MASRSRLRKTVDRAMHSSDDFGFAEFTVSWIVVSYPDRFLCCEKQVLVRDFVDGVKKNCRLRNDVMKTMPGRVIYIPT